jgi:hypothetical protein
LVDQHGEVGDAGAGEGRDDVGGGGAVVGAGGLYGGGDAAADDGGGFGEVAIATDREGVEDGFGENVGEGFVELDSLEGVEYGGVFFP